MFSLLQNHVTKWLLFFLAIFFILATLLIGAYIAYDFKYKNKIYPGIYVGNTHLGGYTTSEAVNILNKKINILNEKGIIFNCEKKETVLYPVIASTDSDLAYQILIYDIEETVNNAYDITRNNGLYKNIMDRIQLLINPIKINALYTFNHEEVANFLSRQFPTLEQPAANAKLNYIPGEKSFKIEEEKEGKRINIDEGIVQLKSSLNNIDNSAITLSVVNDKPIIYKKDATTAIEDAKKILTQPKITLISMDNEWDLDVEKVATWINLKLGKEENGTQKIIIGLDHDLIKDYLKENISPKIEIKPANAKFEIKDGKVVEFQTSQDGRELNLDASAEKIEYELLKEAKNSIELAIKELKSDLQTEKVNDLGIKELIGTGQSNFAGSPQNRRHNIKTGADAVNGTIIKPDQEFSLIETLGEIDAESGYLPELVIKNNKTMPEYGGGLCQVGTTMFRGTVASGLPVTSRRNHSYRVSYYEPAGTDATIYDPWPDYKFLNDTGHHILIQSRIEGDYLFFDFWGTNDGRIASATEPTIYNIVKPGPTKIIETTELEPGVKKCTEHAHNGADAYFDYAVTYPSGEIKEERFKSHYVPWREVCLLGVDKLSTDKNEDLPAIIEPAASSTETTTQ